jgi:hypothetical protein
VGRYGPPGGPRFSNDSTRWRPWLSKSLIDRSLRVRSSSRTLRTSASTSARVRRAKGLRDGSVSARQWDGGLQVVCVSPRRARGSGPRSPRSPRPRPYRRAARRRGVPRSSSTSLSASWPPMPAPAEALHGIADLCNRNSLQSSVACSFPSGRMRPCRLAWAGPLTKLREAGIFSPKTFSGMRSKGRSTSHGDEWLMHARRA